MRTQNTLRLKDFYKIKFLVVIIASHHIRALTIS